MNEITAGAFSVFALSPFSPPPHTHTHTHIHARTPHTSHTTTQTNRLEKISNSLVKASKGAREVKTFEKKLMEMILKDSAKRVKREYNLNDIIIHAGDVGNECFVVEHGSVEVYEAKGGEAKDPSEDLEAGGDDGGEVSSVGGV